MEDCAQNTAQKGGNVGACTNLVIANSNKMPSVPASSSRTPVQYQTIQELEEEGPGIFKP